MDKTNILASKAGKMFIKLLSEQCKMLCFILDRSVQTWTQCSWALYDMLVFNNWLNYGNHLTTAVNHMSTSCQPPISHLSTRCQLAVNPLSNLCRPSVDPLSTLCQPSANHLPTICELTTFILPQPVDVTHTRVAVAVPPQAAVHCGQIAVCQRVVMQVHTQLTHLNLKIRARLQTHQALTRSTNLDSFNYIRKRQVYLHVDKDRFNYI